MGNMMSIINNKESKIDELLNKISKLENEISDLKNKVIINENESKIIVKKNYNIEKYVEKWYENNKNIDIGKINTPFGEIDILPDSIEKHLISQTLMLCLSALEDILENSTLDFFNKKISIKIE
jgi:hypothetical protein